MVFEQLKEKCNCIDVKDSDVDELINLISVFTCWTQKPCETLLTGERKEVVDLPSCICDCDTFIFEPFYRPFDPESFTFTMIEQNGATETVTTITDYTYSIVDENFRIELPLPDCKCKPKCGCESTYKLLVTYIAGYDEIPDCLLPLFCEGLQWIEEKNKCDCTDCQPCDQNYREDGRIDYSTLTGTLQDYFLQMLTKQYIRQLSLISLCDNARSMALWSVVV